MTTQPTLKLPDHDCWQHQPACTECRQVAALVAMTARDTGIDALGVSHVDDSEARYLITLDDESDFPRFKARLDLYWRDLWGCMSL